MIKTTVVVSMVALAGLSACGGGEVVVEEDEYTTGDESSTITVANNSSYAIYRFFMSSVSTNEWGPDQLGADVLQVGGTFTLTGVPCDSYDVRLVDEDEDECVITNVSVCAEDAGWNITDEDLLVCQWNTAVDGSVDAME
jgi:hypothetical protein